MNVFVRWYILSTVRSFAGLGTKLSIFLNQTYQSRICPRQSVQQRPGHFEKWLVYDKMSNTNGVTQVIFKEPKRGWGIISRRQKEKVKKMPHHFIGRDIKSIIIFIFFW